MQNVVLHGVLEDENGDQDLVQTLVNDLHTTVTIQKTKTIGKASEGKVRPIFVVLQSEKEKENIIGNLPD